MYNFMKKENSEDLSLATEDLLENFSYKKSKRLPLMFKAGVLLSSLVIVFFAVILCSKTSIVNEHGEKFVLMNTPIAATASKKDIISIPTGMVKANPFVPYRSIDKSSESVKSYVNDVPKFDLISPPEAVGMHEDAAKIMSTVVSGILYDKFSPSAILNIDGSDYLVKKGDTVNNYTVLAIAKDSVTVKHGNNTYKAGIGELLREGSINYNDVSNLSNKFGGERR